MKLVEHIKLNINSFILQISVARKKNNNMRYISVQYVLSQLPFSNKDKFQISDINISLELTFQKSYTKIIVYYFSNSRLRE